MDSYTNSETNTTFVKSIFCRDNVRNVLIFSIMFEAMQKIVLLLYLKFKRQDF